LNVLDYDYFFKVTEHLLIGDLPASLLAFDEILGNGFEGDHFINGLSDHFRNLMVCKDSRTIRLLEVSEDLKQRYLEQAKLTPLSFLVNALSLASDSDVSYSTSINKRLLVESMLMRMSYLNRVLDGKQIFEPSELEKKNLSNEITTTKHALEKTAALEQKESIQKTISEEKKDGVSEIKHAVKEEALVEKPLEKKATVMSLSIEDLERAVEQELNGPVIVEENNSEVAEAAEVGSYELNNENLEQLWKDMLENLRGKKMQSLYDLIYDKIPTLTNKTIRLVADSSVEKTLIDKDLIGITGFLKSNFLDKSFEFIIEVEEDESKQKLILNQKDKYLKMVQANPMLQKLKEQLDLELEL
jgi:DNA polymerase-3 subunit gamma/tau